MRGTPYLLVWVIAVLAIPCSLQSDVKEAQTKRQAYVTLVYGESFILGVRVLGQSLRESGTTRDQVVLVTGELSESSLSTLRSDGWKVQIVKTLQNPGLWTQAPDQGFPAKFWAVYTKLLVFNMTEYSKVVYLDADAIVVRNMDDVFSCSGFCAALRHSERLNSGVMVLEPSTQMFEDMMSKISTLPSYTGGDQGFLNSYFSGFPAAPLFDPLAPVTDEKVKMMRLPTAYNADAGLYVINSMRWAIPREEIRVIHFTLGSFKPWEWWTTWAMDEAERWQMLRLRLPAESQAWPFGMLYPQDCCFSQMILALTPLLLGAVLFYRYVWSNSCRTFLLTSLGLAGQPLLLSSHNSHHKVAGHVKDPEAALSLPLLSGKLYGLPVEAAVRMPPPALLPPRFAAYAVFAGFISLAIGGTVAAAVVPTQVLPLYGWLLTYEWALFTFAVAFGTYLHLCFKAGAGTLCFARRGLPPPAPRGNGAAALKPWRPTLAYAAAAIVLLCLFPWVSAAIGQRGLAAKVFITMNSLTVVCITLAHFFSQLATHWWVCGRLGNVDE